MKGNEGRGLRKGKNTRKRKYTRDCSKFGRKGKSESEKREAKSEKRKALPIMRHIGQFGGRFAGFWWFSVLLVRLVVSWLWALRHVATEDSGTFLTATV